MGTFNDAIEAVIASDTWCGPGAAKFRGRPIEPGDLYTAVPTGSGFLQYLNISNPTKCLQLFVDLRSEVETDPELTRRGDEYQQGCDTVIAFIAFRCLGRAWARQLGLGFRDGEAAMLVELRSRCTPVEFANGLD